MYRTPEAHVSDIAALLDVSYRTARRVYAKIRKHFGLANKQRPTMEQVKAYLVKE